MIKIIGCLLFFYMTDALAMQHDFILNNNTKVSRASRACDYCGTHRKKCDGKNTCANCRKDKKICVYQEPRKRGRRAGDNTYHNKDLRKAATIPSFVVANNNDLNNNDDLNKKVKKVKKVKKDISEKIVYIEIPDDIKSSDLPCSNDNDIVTKSYTFGDALSEVCDPWIEN